MKKVILMILVLTLLVTSQVWAAWTIKPIEIGYGMGGHIYRWQVVCTSDGDALAATDLLPLMGRDFRERVKKSMLMVMDVSPGTGGVAPDATINISLQNAEGITIYSVTAVSNVADTAGKSLAEDWGQYLPVLEKLYLTLNDIGTAGDQVTLYFTGWVEDR